MPYVIDAKQAFVEIQAHLVTAEFETDLMPGLLAAAILKAQVSFLHKFYPDIEIAMPAKE